MKQFDVETIALHGGHELDSSMSRAVPIYQTSAFNFESTEAAGQLFDGAVDGNIYTRLGNPTTRIFEKRIAMLEGGTDAVATASGQAAVTSTFLNFIESGDEIVSSSHLFVGTYCFFTSALAKLGVKVHLVDPLDPEAFKRAITPNTKAVYTEIIGNPSLQIPNIERLAEIAHEAEVPLIVDNTFGTPVLSNPIKFGADIVIHSATKWIGGHGTSVGGVIVESGKFNWSTRKFPHFNEPDLTNHNICYAIDYPKVPFTYKIRTTLMRDYGACISPFNAFMLIQGIETLPLRMERHVENALKVAEFLENDPAVNWVSYPGLKSHGSYENGKKYLPKGAGSMVCFGIKGGRETAKKFIERLQLWSHISNLGDAKSLVIHPASTSHRHMSTEDLEKSNVPEDLIRLSVGIESINDILGDLEQALKVSQI